MIEYKKDFLEFLQHYKAPIPKTIVIGKKRLCNENSNIGYKIYSDFKVPYGLLYFKDEKTYEPWIPDIANYSKSDKEVLTKKFKQHIKYFKDKGYHRRTYNSNNKVSRKSGIYNKIFSDHRLEGMTKSRYENYNEKSSIKQKSNNNWEYDTEIASKATMENIKWIWKNWLPRGSLTIVAGESGSGKTSLVLSVAAAISRAGTFPDGSTCEKSGKVLIWSIEDDWNSALVPKLDSYKANLDNCRFLILKQKLEDGTIIRRTFKPSEDIKQFEQAVKDLKVSLVILDPVVTAVQRNTNQVNDVRNALQLYSDIAKKYDCAIIGITHVAKGSSDRALKDQVLGSQAFEAQARVVWSTLKYPEEHKGILVKSKSNYSETSGIEYTLEQTKVKNSKNEQIDVSKVVWGEQIEGSPYQIANDFKSTIQQKSKKSGAIEAAIVCIVKLLSRGDLLSKELFSRAIKENHKEITIRRAIEELNLKSYKKGIKGKKGALSYYSLSSLKEIKE